MLCPHIVSAVVFDSYQSEINRRAEHPGGLDFLPEQNRRIRVITSRPPLGAACER